MSESFGSVPVSDSAAVALTRWSRWLRPCPLIQQPSQCHQCHVVVVVMVSLAYLYFTRFKREKDGLTLTQTHTHAQTTCLFNASAYRGSEGIRKTSSAVTKRPCNCCVEQFWPNITGKRVCGRYRSIFNQCDVIGLQSYRIKSGSRSCSWGGIPSFPSPPPLPFPSPSPPFPSPSLPFPFLSFPAPTLPSLRSRTP